jgi:hypothetical protein
MRTRKTAWIRTLPHHSHRGEMDSVPAESERGHEKRTWWQNGSSSRHQLEGTVLMLLSGGWAATRSTIPVPKLPIPFLSPQSPQQRQRPRQGQSRSSIEVTDLSSWSGVGTPVSWLATPVQSCRGGTQANPSHARVWEINCLEFVLSPSHARICELLRDSQKESVACAWALYVCAFTWACFWVK